MSDQNDDNSDRKEFNEAIEAARKLMKFLKPLEESCKDCDKCKETKATLNKIVSAMAKIISYQTRDIKAIETILAEALLAIEKIYETQSDPDELH